MIQKFHLSTVYTKTLKIASQRNVSILVLMEALFILAKIWKELKCPWMDRQPKCDRYVYTLSLNEKGNPDTSYNMDVLENIVLGERSQSKMINATVYFYFLCEMLRVTKIVETENRMVINSEEKREW